MYMMIVMYMDDPMRPRYAESTTTAESGMARSQAEKAESHEKILEVAGKKFREKGLGGIGVAQLMGAAGLTHGGFYCHFKSRAHLVEAAIDRVFQQSEKLKDERHGAGRGGLNQYVEWYLSADHREDLAHGCPLAALAADVRHEDKRARMLFAAGLHRYFEWIGGFIGGRAATRRAKATLATSAMVGAVILSRAVEKPEDAEQILDQVRNELRAYLK